MYKNLNSKQWDRIYRSQANTQIMGATDFLWHGYWAATETDQTHGSLCAANRKEGDLRDRKTTTKI